MVEGPKCDGCGEDLHLHSRKMLVSGDPDQVIPLDMFRVVACFCAHCGKTYSVIPLSTNQDQVGAGVQNV